MGEEAENGEGERAEECTKSYKCRRSVGNVKCKLRNELKDTNDAD